MVNRIKIAGMVISIPRIVEDAQFLVRLCITNPKKPGKKTSSFKINVFIPKSCMPDGITNYNPLTGKGILIVGQLQESGDDVSIVVTRKAVVLDRRKGTTRSVKKRRLGDS